jgi:hypothetical protein
MKILYDCGILFWYCRIQKTNENISIFQPYVNLIVIDSVEQGEARVIDTTTFAFHNGKLDHTWPCTLNNKPKPFFMCK